MNTSKLLGVLRENSDTQAKLADAIGVSVQRLNSKIHAKDGADFTANEIRAIKDRYNLSAEDIDEIFFCI
jgi:DNA-binding transcriptional regulator YiaG